MSVDYRPDYDPADVDSDYGHTGGDITVPTFTANMKPFRFWCQKALPLVYDDSLSYYEVLCKVVKQLNDFLTDLQTATGAIDQFAQQFVINQQFLNDMADQLGQNVQDLETYINDRMDDFMTAYTQLQTYVNNYFDNLDVQHEINNKLDDMAEDGTFNTLFDPVITAWMTAKTAQIDAAIADQNVVQSQQNGRISVLEGRMDTFASLPAGSTSGNAELLDIRTNFLGETYPTAGDAVRASDMIASGFQSISATKLEEWDGNSASPTYDTIQIDIGGYKGGHVVVIGSFKFFQQDIQELGRCAVYATNTQGKVEDSNAVNYLPGAANSIFKNFRQLTTGISGEERLLLQFAIPDDYAYQYLKIGHFEHFEHSPLSGSYTEPLYIVYANSWSKTPVDDTLTIAGAAADAKATGDALSEVNERIDIQNDILDSLNSNYYYDISEYGETNPSFTINNLSFVYDSEEHVYNINGSSSSAVNRNIYNNSTGFPGDIKPGDIVRINYIGENSTANCYIQIFFYTNNSWDNAVYVYSPKIIQIPSTATGMLIRIVVTATANVTNGVLGLSMYRNASNNDLENAVPYIKPNASGDLTSTIEMMLNLYGHVKLGAGTYIVNNLHMPDNSSISGCGNNTVLQTTDGTAHAIIPGAWCNIENLKIVGTKGTISSTRSVDAGIYIAGNYEDGPLKRNIKISNCTIRDFGLAGIYGKATGYWVGNSISAVNCEVCYCYAGVLLEDYCEFNRFTNILTYVCYVGLMNKSGNNIFVNCSFSNNRVGVYLDCTDDDTSNNNGHGAIIGATINHSNNNNGYGILVKKVETNGFTFDTCQIWYSKIQIENSSGVIVQNCTFGGGTPLIESYTNGAFFLKNNLFKTAPTLTGTMIKEGNYLFDGSVVA